MSQSNSITVTINDVPRRLFKGCTLEQLIKQSELNPRQIAVERNLEIVPPSRFSTTILEADDSLEIVTLMGGG